MVACLLVTWPPLFLLLNPALHHGERLGVAFSRIPLPVGGWDRFCHCDTLAQDPEVLRTGELVFSRCRDGVYGSSRRKSWEYLPLGCGHPQLWWLCGLQRRLPDLGSQPFQAPGSLWVPSSSECLDRLLFLCWTLPT